MTIQLLFGGETRSTWEKNVQFRVTRNFLRHTEGASLDDIFCDMLDKRMIRRYTIWPNVRICALVNGTMITIALRKKYPHRSIERTTLLGACC